MTDEPRGWRRRRQIIPQREEEAGERANPLDIASFIDEYFLMREIRHYLTKDGHDLFQQWREGLRDRRASIAIDRRVNRMELDNFGDHKFCRDGVWELRIDHGPGYRVYYGMDGEQIVLLLCGGDKRRNRMTSSAPSPVGVTGKIGVSNERPLA